MMHADWKMALHICGISYENNCPYNLKPKMRSKLLLIQHCSHTYKSSPRETCNRADWVSLQYVLEKKSLWLMGNLSKTSTDFMATCHNTRNKKAMTICGLLFPGFSYLHFPDLPTIKFGSLCSFLNVLSFISLFVTRRFGQL